MPTPWSPCRATRRGGSQSCRVTDLLAPLASHILLSGAALALGLAIALPLVLWSARNAAVARIALGLAGLIQTVPALALLALFYPVLLWLSALAGGGIPALGFLPAFLALALYAVLPILRNGVAGLAGIDPAVRQAADGVGMTARQKLWLVEAPLVAPVLMAGIRTAAVWTIGAATLSTTVGQPSLGDPIFAGLQTQNWALVLKGCAAAAGLALVADALLGLIERGVAGRRRWRIGAGLVGILFGLALATAPMLRPAGGRVVTVGAKNFSEQFILARLIGARLAAAGYTVHYREGLGSAVIFRALERGDIDIYVDYAGTLWTNEMKRKDVPDRKAMIAAIGAWTQRSGDARLVGPLGFENAYAFAMRGAAAKARGIATLDDLARASPELKLGSDLEFLERPEWAAVKAAYPMRFAVVRAYSPSFMYRALGDGTVDVISAFSSDGRIAADGLTVLRDSRGAIPGYDALLLVNAGRLRDRRLMDALRPLVGRIGVEPMRAANYRVDRDEAKQTPEAAAQWLAAQVAN
ncbi:MAG: ABC transporter permease/substrate-binding protein [Sphingobium sp.]